MAWTRPRWRVPRCRRSGSDRARPVELLHAHWGWGWGVLVVFGGVGVVRSAMSRPPRRPILSFPWPPPGQSRGTAVTKTRLTVDARVTPRLNHPCFIASGLSGSPHHRSPASVERRAGTRSAVGGESAASAVCPRTRRRIRPSRRQRQCSGRNIPPRRLEVSLRCCRRRRRHLEVCSQRRTPLGPVHHFGRLRSP